jgi:phosphatidylglycerol:prolipoprotein diacylglycerol transferase
MIFLTDLTPKPINNVAFSIFGQDIYWYAIFILTGALAAFFLGIHFAKRVGISVDTAFDGFTYGLIVGVIGARLYYVLFDPRGAIHSFWEIFNTRGGGLAIHGAIIATAIYVPIFCKIKKINILNVVECVVPGFLMAQAIGRWGNFFNQEAHGPLIPGTLAEQRAYLENMHLPKFIVDQMYISKLDETTPVAGYYHPTFLYEMLWNWLGVAIILIGRKYIKKLYVGDSLCFYLVWYGIGRYFVEAMRTDPLMAGSVKIAQLMSILFILGGVALFILRRVFHFYMISIQETFYRPKDIEVDNNEHLAA